jgi:hypothetical protein
MEGSVRSKKPFGHNGIQMSMKPGSIPEGVDHHDHPWDTFVDAQHRAEEEIEGSIGAVVQLGEELLVVYELNPKAKSRC